jgi:hypothetical protein
VLKGNEMKAFSMPKNTWHMSQVVLSICSGYDALLLDGEGVD